MHFVAVVGRWWGWHSEEARRIASAYAFEGGMVMYTCVHVCCIMFTVLTVCVWLWFVQSIGGAAAAAAAPPTAGRQVAVAPSIKKRLKVSTVVHQTTHMETLDHQEYVTCLCLYVCGLCTSHVHTLAY